MEIVVPENAIAVSRSVPYIQPIWFPTGTGNACIVIINRKLGSAVTCSKSLSIDCIKATVEETRATWECKVLSI